MIHCRLALDLPLPEYRATRLLRESGHSRVFEAVADGDDRRVVAKVFDIEDASVEDRVLHEFELIKRLDIPGVVVARELRRVGDQLVLLLDHVSGVDLREFTRGAPLELTRFWSIATQLADILARVHAHEVVHRDIKPTNVIVDDDGGVHLVDFGISVLLESERRHIYDHNVLVGTLPYISPEQTGRTNRAVDLRSDLYSLGVTLYELLTGRRPFEDLAALELIHAHLARTAEAPSSLRPTLPEALSRLVMKLLAKAPEHRYQTAAGVAVDLRRIQARALSGVGEGPCDAPFQLGSADVSPQLRLPHQIYGRERERAALLDNYRAVVESGSTGMTLMTGPEGMGKSALLRVLAVAVASDQGYLARGAFTQSRELPYSGFVEALSRLLEQLLTEDRARLSGWRRRLREGLGSLAGVLCELIPRLGLVLGERPPSPELEPIEARNRLQLALARLLATLCTKRRPLVLGLDDLQHADEASLALLENLMTGSTGPLLIITTLDDDELEQAHPLTALLAAGGDESGHSREVRRLAIGPLSLAAIQALLADTLGLAQAEVEGLARIVARKTGGVPMFIGQFLADLVDQRALRPGASRWSWDEAAIERTQIPDDAAAMMTSRLRALEPEARELLGRAACIGDRFEFAQLTVVSATPRPALAAICFELVDLGLLSSFGHEYAFTHESLQRAALAQLDAPKQRELHWKLGRHLLEHHQGGDDRLFEIVDHLDLGASADPDAQTRLELARLNVRAGRRGLDSGAYEVALRYLDHGIELLAPWIEAVSRDGPATEHYELAFNLHFARAQCLGLSHASRQDARTRANEAFDSLLGWRLADPHFGHVVARRCRILRESNRPAEAVALALSAMARLGRPIPRSPGLPRALLGLVRAWWGLRSLGRAGMMAMTPVVDPRVAALIDIVAELKYSAFACVDNGLFLYLGGLHVQLIHRHGFHPSAPVALGDLSIAVSGALGRSADAIEIVEAALELCERLPNPAAARLGVTVPGAALTLHRGRPFSESAQLMDASYPVALESGEFERASLLAMMACQFPMEIGMHLSVLERRCRRFGSDLERWGSKQAVTGLWLMRCWCVSMLGGTADDASVRAGLMDVRDIEAAMIHARGGAPSAIYAAYVNRALFHLLMDDPRQAASESLEFINKVARIIINSWFIPRAALVLTVAVHRLRIRGEQPPAGADAAARKSLRVLQTWAKAGPESYGHYRDLALGVRAAARGNLERATEQLERAWTQARRQGCRWVEGLTAECAAELLDLRGLSLLADGAWRRTYDAYAAWGATAKLERLRAAKPQLFEDSIRAAPSAELSSCTLSLSGLVDPYPSSEPTGTLAPDLEAVLRTVGVITEDLGLEQVTCRVLDAAMTSAGADHCMLLLEQDGQLTLVARGSSSHEATLFEDAPLLRDAGDRAPATLINFVARTSQWLVLDDASEDPRFASDPYVVGQSVRSMLALPILKGQRRLGVLVLENRLTTHGFTARVIETLRLITGQAASVLDNARLYAALSRSEARWRSLVDSAPDLIALLDERGEVVLLNRSGPLLGLGRGSGPAMDAGDAPDALGSLTQESAARWREAIHSVLDQGLAQERTLEFVTPAGVHGWYEARLAPLELEAGFEGSGTQITRRNAVVIATDISDRKRAEADRQQLEAQLRQQQRLDSIGTLASGVAHEINNPIQGIMNYAELIESNSSAPAMVEDFAAEIAHESARVAAIVRNLLSFSRREQQEEQRRELIELSEIIDTALSLIRSVLRKDDIVLEIDPGQVGTWVSCQPQTIQQIILNLVTNARDALNERDHDAPDPHGHKRISLRVQHLLRDSGETWARLVVEDNAQGIPAEILAHIFDPFFTTKPNDRGTGLGLSISHGIAKDNGGELSVETTLGQGTRFYLDLPLAEPP